MSGEWYYRILAADFGPVTFEMIGDLAAHGTLSPQDEVRCGPDGPWVRAGTIVGLFPEDQDAGELPTREESAQLPDTLEEVQDLSELDFEFVESSSVPLPASVGETSVEARGAAAAGDTTSPWVERLEAAPPAASDPRSEKVPPETSRGSRPPDADAARKDTVEMTTFETETREMPVLPAESPAARRRSSTGKRPARRGGRPGSSSQKLEDEIAGWLEDDSEPPVTARSQPTAPRPPVKLPDPPPPAAASPTPAPPVFAAPPTRPAPEPQRPAMPVPARPAPDRASVAGLAAIAAARQEARTARGSAGSGTAPLSAAVGWLTSNIKIIAGVLAVVAVAAFLLKPGTNPHKAYHETYTAVYNEFKGLRARKASGDDWDQFARDVERRVAPIVAALSRDVERSSGKIKDGQNHLLAIGQRHLPDMLADSREKITEAERDFQEAMKQAVAAFNYFR